SPAVQAGARGALDAVGHAPDTGAMPREDADQDGQITEAEAEDLSPFSTMDVDDIVGEQDGEKEGDDS
ncbi:hypothetical protein ACFU99_12010, partial [Streptomyces sp. NPDC057654]|uniref:hypothetical protein n=1 Tax=Streptomyces sp. NPDC057654 TaxID=3346196 RepID=UPI003692A2B3